MAYVRTVKTASGATAVQIVWSTRRGSRQIEHLGSAHDDGEVEALKAAARQRLAEGQGALDLGLDTAGVYGDPLEIVVGFRESHGSGHCFPSASSSATYCSMRGSRGTTALVVKDYAATVARSWRIVRDQVGI